MNIPENYHLSKVKGTENRAELLLLLSNNGELDNHDLPNGCDSSLNKPKIREVSNTITTRYDAGIQNQQTIGMCVVENIKIKNATKKGYLEAEEGDGIDISSRMEHHRGTVQKGKSQTLTTMGGENIGVVIKENIPNKVIKVGNYSPSNHNASSIIDAGGGSSYCNGKSWDNNCNTRK